MRPCTNAFKTACVQSHNPISRVDVLRDGKVIRQLDVHDGSVTADRTAAQMRNFDVEVSDPTGTLTPEGMQSLLAPFGTRMQLWRGVRLENVQTLVFYANSQAAWQVSGTSFGVLNGVVGDLSTGALILGP